ncbi:MAG: FtsQ-type POTRA domain-containing protein [Rhodospirillaceae bacterium]|nr:FtsQ-type POTRA domain-containing protein [Rhodospirillaceae bacterium]
MRWLRRRPPEGAQNGRRGARRAPVRRRPPSRLRRLSLLWGLPGVVLAGAVGGGWWLTSTGWTDRMLLEAEHRLIEGAELAKLTLRKIQVEGRHETPPEAILAALQVVDGDPILSADPAVIKRRLERLAWVKSATVERRLPDTLYLRLEEHEPMAIWQRDHRLVLIGRTGQEIQPPRPGDFQRYLVVVGDDAPANTPALLEMLAKAPDLAARVTAAVRVGGRRWDLQMNNGVHIRLPEDGAVAAWLKLARLQRQHGLLERDITAVDLRFPDRIIVPLTPEAAERYHAPKDST